MNILGFQLSPGQIIGFIKQHLFEQRLEKTCLWGFQPGPTQTRLYNQKMARGLKNLNLGNREIVLCVYSENKGTVHLHSYSDLCCKNRFSHDASYLSWENGFFETDLYGPPSFFRMFKLLLKELNFIFLLYVYLWRFK